MHDVTAALIAVQIWRFGVDFLMSYGGDFLSQQAGFSTLNCQKSYLTHKHGWLGRGTFSIVRSVTDQRTGMRALACVDATHQH